MTAKVSKTPNKSPVQGVVMPKFKVKRQKSILKTTPTPVAAGIQQKAVTNTEKKKNKSKRISFDVAPTAEEEKSPASTDGGEALPESTAERQPLLGAKQPKKRKPRSQEKIEKRAERLQRNEAAVLHLRTWHSNRSEWKYQRKLQAHLIQKCLSKHCLNKQDFSIFLEYATTIKGGSLQWLFTVCEEKLKELKEKKANSSENEEALEDKTQRSARVRASKILKRIRTSAFESVAEN